MQKKWIYGCIIGAVLLVGAAGACFYSYSARMHQQRVNATQKTGLQTAAPVYMDLLYLNSTADLKITPAQAKTILPLVEKLKAADVKTVPDLSKQIYTQLDAPQYLALQSRSREPGMGYMKESHIRGRRTVDKDRLEAKRNYSGQMLRQAALPDILIRDLKNLAAQTQ